MNRLRRPDWLREMQGVLILGLVVTAGSALAVVANADAPTLAVAGTAHTVADPTPGQRLLWIATSLPTPVVIAAILVQLLRIVRAARRSDPFTPATVQRLRVLAVVAIAGGYAASFLQILASAALSSGTVAAGSLPASWLLTGFGALAAAEVVNRGCALRAELESVI
jgi:hypothetical protein